jgi:CheY-like chemotaxis protein
MPVKILLADKSITIQKVIEMLFSGKEYEVTCVSDGEAALNDASRVIPDVILADVDLPRIDGYSFALRLKQKPSLAQTPVILMQSRDDIFDEARAKEAGIIDHIAKPFESQDLIGKVKKALTVAPPRLGEPTPAPLSPPAAAAPAATPAAAAAPKPSMPPDIFDIIREAPGPSVGDAKQAAAPSPPAESEYEVEPVFELAEPPLVHDAGTALPVGEKAVEEIRTGLGLSEQPQQGAPEFTNFETLDAATAGAREYMPPQRETRTATPAFEEQAIPVEALKGIAEETIARLAREVLERVAWEVIPDLAERLIQEEIQRLKAGM